LFSLHRFVLRVAALALSVGFAAAAAQPQANDTESGHLDDAGGALKQIYATLQEPDLSKADLEKLKEEAQRSKPRSSI